MPRHKVFHWEPASGLSAQEIPVRGAPCPFCCGIALTVNGRRSKEAGLVSIAVECEECSTRGPEVTVGEGAMSIADQTIVAIMQWNRALRPADPEPKLTMPEDETLDALVARMRDWLRPDRDPPISHLPWGMSGNELRAPRADAPEGSRNYDHSELVAEFALQPRTNGRSGSHVANLYFVDETIKALPQLLDAIEGLQKRVNELTTHVPQPENADVDESNVREISELQMHDKTRSALEWLYNQTEAMGSQIKMTVSARVGLQLIALAKGCSLRSSWSQMFWFPFTYRGTKMWVEPFAIANLSNDRHPFAIVWKLRPEKPDELTTHVPQSEDCNTKGGDRRPAGW